ncbi:MAG: cupredoxin domain-containing protein [Chloroflexales bacterium]|nr:cupredoxin domain-containing protein [Chloroflexales bacterium]
MKFQKLSGVLVLLVALVLGACGGSPPAESPTATTAADPTPTTQPTLQPTPTFESVSDVEEVVGASAASGALAWRDQILRSDAIVVSITGLAQPPAGEVYAAWLANNENSLPLGALRFDNNGIATLNYVSPDQQNLLGKYDRAYITQASQDAATTASENVVMSGALPPEALIHIRHVLFSIPVTPDKTGFALGLRQETDELFRHAQFLRDAFTANDLGLEKVHAEHIINIIRGSEARDVNGDGKVQNPGDGFGLLPNGQQDGYIKGMIDHAKLAADALDATDDIKLHSSHVQISGENTQDRIDQIRALAEKIAAAGSIADTQQDVLGLLALTEQAIQGIDIDLDEQVAPIPGEGGVITAYQHAQLMARVPLTPSTGVEAVPAAEVTSGEGQEIEVAIGDNTFTPGKITVPVGSTVVWTHQGQRPHTVTADDGSFDSGELANGNTFSFTFTVAGTFPYYCAFHGGPGGEGMAGTIVVEDASDAAGDPVLPPSPPNQQPDAPAPAPGDNVTVAIGDNTFDGQDITVPVGSTVVWTHQGQRPHTVTADDGSFNSNTLQNGDSFSQTFSEPGVYQYYCEFHGSPGRTGMSGVIRVGDGSSALPPASPSPTPSPAPPAPASTTAPAPTYAPPSSDANVTVGDNTFTNNELTIPVGSTVVWTHQGQRPHTVTADDGSFNSNTLQNGDSFSQTFSEPGVYQYYCEFHGSPGGTGMSGVVIVEP